VVRTRLDNRAAAELVLRAIAAVDPRLSHGSVQTLEGVTRVGTLPQRLAAALTSTLGALALVLSGMGIYGVVANMVAQRRREIGVRMALGAQARAVAALVVRSSLRLVVPGLVAGGIAAIAIARLMRAFILGVTPADPLTLVVVPLTLAVMIALATWLPARRASRVSPLSALKSE
jgi:ABC-type antimicrobial peptide transport system permease subunit